MNKANKLDRFIQVCLIVLAILLTLLTLLKTFGALDDRKTKDLDLDGFVSTKYGGNDCNDMNGNINPDAIDIPNDSIDQNCDGKDSLIFPLGFDEDGDLDKDGYSVSIDCDDTDSSINLSQAEIFDLKDNNCNGYIDEGFQTITLYNDFVASSYESEVIIRTSTNLETAVALQDAYLYIEASVDDPERQLTRYDSIYIYIDDGSKGGLIRRDQSLIHSMPEEHSTKLLYNLNSVPIIRGDYRESGEFHKLDFLKTLNVLGKHRIGSFVGTQRSGILKKMIIGYKQGIIKFR